MFNVLRRDERSEVIPTTKVMFNVVRRVVRSTVTAKWLSNAAQQNTYSSAFPLFHKIASINFIDFRLVYLL